PDVPVNAFVVDPNNSNNLFAGTDIGVFNSTDGGATWNPFGTGLPRVAVFDMAIQNPNRVLRIATHGRGMWEVSLGANPTPTPTPTPVGGSVQFAVPQFSIIESDGAATIAVVRSGDTSTAASVSYATADGTATQKGDYIFTAGTLFFAPGETSKPFTVLI